MYLQKEATLKDIEAKAAAISIASEEAMQVYLKLRQVRGGCAPRPHCCRTHL